MKFHQTVFTRKIVKKYFDKKPKNQEGLHAWATTAGSIGPLSIPIHISTEDATIIAKSETVTWKNLYERLDSDYGRFPLR